MDSIEARPQPAPAPRAPRIANACEACRAAKVKCQPGAQLGICKRCSESKRECIFKTGPRTRRPRQLKKRLNHNNLDTTTPGASSASIKGTHSTTTTAAAAAAAVADSRPTYPPPPGPSKTFTIDIPMPADDDIIDSLEALRLTHEQAIDLLTPHLSSGDEDEEMGMEMEMEIQGGEYDQDDQDDQDQASVSGVGSVLSHASSLPVGASALSTPPSSVSVVTTTTAAAADQSQAVQGSGGSGGISEARGGATAKSRTLASLRLQPQFNLDSAGKLLDRFRDVMIGHFHCVAVGEDETVATMARERPFVLLALLAAASGSRTLQGHSLYDEEFRKVLGLKFVAGGERTLELLQGLVIYIAWYPSHLRPKNKHSIQYLRMVVDIISDLELDQDPGTDSMDLPPTRERIDQIRLYLASYYLASATATAWGRSPSLTYTNYTARCCDLLQRHSPLQGDHVLAWQVRLQRPVEETNDLRRTQRGQSQSEYHIGLMLRGMETQLAEWEEAGIDPAVAAVPSIRLAILFTRIFLSGAPLLTLPSVKLRRTTATAAAASDSSFFRADPQRLMAVIPALHALYEFFLALRPDQLNSFIGVEWSRFILSVILGFRMTLPLAVCPEWDDRAAREAVRFGEYLDRLCRMGGDPSEVGSGFMPTASGAAAPGSFPLPAAAAAGGDGGQTMRSMDVLSASKIVLEMVKTKYWKRVARVEAKLQQHQQLQHEVEAMLAAAAPHPMPSGEEGKERGNGSIFGGCPMMDGSLEPYYPYWDETFNNNLTGSGFGVVQAQGADTAEMNAGGPSLSNDLWTAMTMGWAQGDINLGAL